MGSFADARTGVEKYLKDKRVNLSREELDDIIIDAVRRFSRRVPRRLAVAVDGLDDHDYPIALIPGFVEDVSHIKEVFFPYTQSEQDPTRLELKDFELFQRDDGLVLRFKRDSPTTIQKFLVQFTTTHTATATGAPEDISDLSPTGTVLGPGVSTSQIIDVESAKDIQIFLKIAAGSGTLAVEIQASENGVDFFPIGAFDNLIGSGTFAELLDKFKVSKKIRLKYTVSAGGSFTLGATVGREGTAGTFTIKDDHLDAFSYLAASMAATALQAFYAGTSSSSLNSDVTDYESKATFWKELGIGWKENFEEEMQRITPSEEAAAGAIGEWDIKGQADYTYQLHNERLR